MKRLWQIVYSLAAIPLLWGTLRLMALGNAKIRRGIRGRKHLFATLAGQTSQLGRGKRIWFHSSSLGEFEQAKPIIAELKRQNPEVRIIVSFFSPSGFEHARKYPLADVITYLPFDTRAGARRFLDLVRPDVAVMVRYDVWPNHIWELERRGIPTLIANATMRRNTRRRFPMVRTLHHYVYNALDEILTVTQDDSAAFTMFALDRPAVHVIGDTRYDQVLARSAEARKRHIIPQAIIEGKQVVVAGSTWPEDEDVILPAILRLHETTSHLLLILVPHEPTVENLENLEAELTGKTSFIRFSALNEYGQEKVIIVDSIGILLILYAYAHIAFIGGGFRQGVHNVLEAAVFGVPVLFGPRHRNSQEPLMLVERGGGFVVNDSKELYRTLRNLLEDDLARSTAGGRASRFVQANLGATGRFLHHLERHLGVRNAEPSHRNETQGRQ
jgi:3-deoxy-D-manno-octulosonic-acid transferase